MNKSDLRATVFVRCFKFTRLLDASGGMCFGLSDTKNNVRVLYLSPRDSWPPKSGARLRDYHFARALARQTDLVYLYFAASPGENTLREQLPGASLVTALAAPQKYTPAKVLKGLLGGRPLPVENYTSPEMMKAVEKQIQGGPFDIVHLDSIHLAAYGARIARLAPRTKLVLDWHNIESELMLRYASQSSSLSRRSYANWTAKRLTRLESTVLRNYHGHLVCSSRERAELLRRAPESRVAVIENGVDTDYFRPESSGQRAHRLVFVGQMSYHANADGILWFVREIWPSLRRRYPSLTLSVVGSDPGPAIQALASGDGIEVTGTVPDVRSYYAGALAAIVPLQTGGGTRLKVLEGMSAGVPVISTALGAEGLNLQAGNEFVEAGSQAEDWVRAIEAVSDPANRIRLVETARARVCSEFDWTRIGDRLVSLYRDGSGW